MIHKAQKSIKRIVYTEGEEEKIIHAANEVFTEKIGMPILLGDEEMIKSKIVEFGYEVDNFEVADPDKSDKFEKYAQEFYQSRFRKGITIKDARELMHQPNYFGSMMVKMGDADTLIGGLTYHYPQTIRPALQCVGIKQGFNICAGLYIVIIKKKVFFFADTTVNIDPNPEQLAEIAIMTSETVKQFDIQPRIAMLSFSNFGSAKYPQSEKVRKAVQIIHSKRPDLMVDGEMQADTAVIPERLEKDFPFSVLKGGANVLIFPNLDAGNIAYKLFERLTGATVIGPLLMGMNKSIHVLQRGATVNDIVNMSAIAVVEAAQTR
jgi:malate dehydrogenase (oxaloacetate-decarboxylating)(NADP+)